MVAAVEIDAKAKAAILEAQVRAALGGHDIGPFDPVASPAGGYHSECRKCGQTVWLRDDGLMYSLLEESCPA